MSFYILCVIKEIMHLILSLFKCLQLSKCPTFRWTPTKLLALSLSEISNKFGSGDLGCLFCTRPQNICSWSDLWYINMITAENSRLKLIYARFPQWSEITFLNMHWFAINDTFYIYSLVFINFICITYP